MRFDLCLCTFGLILTTTLPAVAAERRILMSAIDPQRHGGHYYVPVADAAWILRAPYRWRRADRTIEVGLKGRVARFRVGSRNAMLNGRAVRLAVAPYRREGHTFIPLRLTGQALGVPLGFDQRTESLTVGPMEDGKLLCIPLPTRQTGIVIHSPTPGAESELDVRVHGQFNLLGGDLVVQLQDAQGNVLEESKISGTPGTVGVFREFITILLHGSGNGTRRELQVVAFSPSPADGQPLHKVTVPVVMRRSK